MAAGKGFTNHVVSIDTVHQHIHEGIMFSAHQYDDAVANDGTLAFLIQVPAGVSPHLRPRAAAGGDAEVRLFEAPTFSAAGSAAAALNRKRSSDITALATVTTGPTVSVNGTELDATYVPGGSRNQAVGGSAGFFQEWILAPSTNYLVLMTNKSGGSAELALALDWYEHR